MSIVDFMIHLKTELPLDQRAQLESEMCDLEGVMSACFSPSHPHMMEVTYNPDVVSSSMVMDQVSQRGIVAQKVGL
ncbi:MAG: hypothetical protein K8H84_12450 [Sulfuricella denitrificans]|nr:hypothetical protein [Sulfuricella denitrificans]